MTVARAVARRRVVVTGEQELSLLSRVVGRKSHRERVAAGAAAKRPLATVLTGAGARLHVSVLQ